MTVAKATGASPALWSTWEQIDWSYVYHAVRRLQVRIAQAARARRWGKVKALQHCLTRSYLPNLWAVRRVVTNDGKNTPGVDGIIWETDEDKMDASRTFRFRGYRPQPLRRVYLPKANGKLRPLGIPTMNDRAMQALFALALEPVAEVLADADSYGFRRGRSLHDAIGQCFVVLAKKVSPQWVLEGDIRACFDQISHDWLLAHIPMETKILRGWLKAGYLEDGARHATEAGTPQGGIIAPILANRVLDDLEMAVRCAVPKGRGHKVNVVRYADDFMVTGASKALLDNTVKPAITDFLATRGLTLSEEKTHISHIDQGFDFPGVNLRKYGGTLLIKPAPKKVQAFLASLRDVIKANVACPFVPFLKRLNSKLRSWAQHYRHVVSKRVFSEVDTALYFHLRRWTRLRHRKRTDKWCKQHDWHRVGMRWVFGSQYTNRKGQTSLLTLFKLSDLPIVRHIKVQKFANPFLPVWNRYDAERRLARFIQRRRDRVFLATSPLTRMAW